MKGVSIIVPVWGNINLKPLLKSIKDVKYELIIVGNISDDIDSSGPYINYIRTNENRSEARNIGASFANYETLLFLDSDMELSDNFFDKSLNDISEHDALNFPELTLGNNIIAMGRRYERVGLYRSIYFEAPRMIKKPAFNKINGYNKRLNAFEDLDLTRKLINNDFSIGWSDSIIYHHEENIKFIDYLKKRISYTRDNKIIFSNEDTDFVHHIRKIRYRYNSFLNSARYYGMKSIYYIPAYLIVTLINVFTFVVIK